MRDDTMKPNVAGMIRLGLLAFVVGSVLSHYGATPIVVLPVSFLIGVFYPEKAMIPK